MITLGSTLYPAREAGVVYTKPWMVELVLDLAGYLPEKRLAELVALEPSAGDGAFLSAMVRRLVESCERHGTPLSKAASALQAFEIDPEAAEKIDPRNVRRTIRALEVILSSGRRFSAQRGKVPSPYDVIRVGLTRPRSELYAIIDARIDGMIRKGLVDEVQRLLSQGYGPDLPSMSAIGYRQVARFLLGEYSLEEAMAEMKRLTRRYVRQQGAWFREEDPDIHWFSVNEQTADRVIELIRRWLTGDIHHPA